MNEARFRTDYISLCCFFPPNCMLMFQSLPLGNRREKKNGIGSLEPSGGNAAIMTSACEKNAPFISSLCSPSDVVVHISSI